MPDDPLPPLEAPLLEILLADGLGGTQLEAPILLVQEPKRHDLGIHHTRCEGHYELQDVVQIEVRGYGLADLGEDLYLTFNGGLRTHVMIQGPSQP